MVAQNGKSIRTFVNFEMLNKDIVKPMLNKDILQCFSLV